MSTRPVVVGVDGRSDSAGALRYAAIEAGRRHAPLRLVHVVPSVLGLGPTVALSDLAQTGRSILARARATARDLAPGTEATTVLLRGDRSTGIVRTAETAQLVVIGRETRRGLDRLLTGTTTIGVAAHAPCDVVVVPSSWAGDHPHGRVVVGLKTREDSRELLAHAFAEAGRRHAAIGVVTAWELADPYQDQIESRTHAADWEAKGREMLLDLTAEWRAEHPDVPVEAQVVHGSPVEVLMDASKDADLLVISRRHFAWPPYGRLGGVGHALLRLSEAPVQVVPYTAEGPVDEPLVLEADGVLLK